MSLNVQQLSKLQILTPRLIYILHSYSTLSRENLTNKLINNVLWEHYESESKSSSYQHCSR